MYGRAVACVFLAIATALAALDVRAQTVVRPLSVTGPYPVACTNVEQDSAPVPAGEIAEMYWRGASTGSKKRYVDALLVAPANALTSVRSRRSTHIRAQRAHHRFCLRFGLRIDDCKRLR